MSSIAHVLLVPGWDAAAPSASSPSSASGLSACKRGTKSVRACRREPDDRADRHLKSEDVAHQLGHLALGEPINPHQHRDDGIHRRSERARGDALWQLAHRPVVAQPAVERVLRVLRDNRLDGRQLEHLMSMRFSVLAMQEPRAHLALLRDTGNTLVDLFRGHQHALVPLVPWLCPRLAPRRRLLRPCLHPGTVAGRRLR